MVKNISHTSQNTNASSVISRFVLYRKTENMLLFLLYKFMKCLFLNENYRFKEYLILLTVLKYTIL
jgi:hypothetical protein